MLYRDGTVVNKDALIAWDYFEIAAKQNNNSFCSRPHDRIWAIWSSRLSACDALLQESCRTGSYFRRCELRVDTLKLDPNEEQEAEIHTWSKVAIKAGNKHAMVNYGYLNLYEKLKVSDRAYGLKLTIQAAELGELQAIKNLYYYYSGSDNIIAPDNDQAEFWKQQLPADEQARL